MNHYEFLLFPKLTKENAIRLLNSMPKNEFQACFQIRERRLYQCIDARGKYVKGGVYFLNVHSGSKIFTLPNILVII